MPVIYHYDITKALMDNIIARSRLLQDRYKIKDGIISPTMDIERLDRIGSPILVMRIEAEDIAPYKTSAYQTIFTTTAIIMYLVAGNSESVIFSLSVLTDELRDYYITNPEVLSSSGIYLTYISSISPIEIVTRRDSSDYAYRSLTFRLYNYYTGA